MKKILAVSHKELQDTLSDHLRIPSRELPQPHAPSTRNMASRMVPQCGCSSFPVCIAYPVNVQMGAQYAAELPYELVQLPRAGPEDVC